MGFVERLRAMVGREQARLDAAQQRYNESQRERRAAEEPPAPARDPADAPMAVAPAPAGGPTEAPTAVSPALAPGGTPPAREEPATSELPIVDPGPSPPPAPPPAADDPAAGETSEWLPAGAEGRPSPEPPGR